MPLVTVRLTGQAQPRYVEPNTHSQDTGTLNLPSLLPSTMAEAHLSVPGLLVVEHTRKHFAFATQTSTSHLLVH